ncbi:hypothetical protein CKM354_000948100 [Cercospora kikuchii]|uniref:Phospholipase D/nuclease n=1 Tax=Cercospora kikuchii TaxID=84275 RepID=A0A9P3FG86_9PEZI|nr:uncharacterized protein CKM354_000948100 [Cercospora kikuchii]GIZ46353.1 hypothetical protein CKM354_000948100 [Cercospora kikuchii]
MADTDSEDEQLKAAIALSLSEQQQTAASAASTPAPPPVGLAGLDRKAMEAARLARTASKRPRSVSPPPLRDTRKAPKIMQKSVDLPSGARLNMLSSAIQQDQQARKPAAARAAMDHVKAPLPTSAHRSSNSTSSNGAGSLLYPRGVIKKTWAFGHERNSNDIKIEEVLEPLSVRTAVLSAFQWDVQWVLSKLKTPLNGGTTKCIFVMQAKEQEDRDRWREDASDMRHFLRLCFPNMNGLINCMHSKLMLLFHAHKLRIAIPTANLLNFDWGETGQMENSVFMIDLPRLPDDPKAKATEFTSFQKELIFFLEKQGLDQDVRDGVSKFDFSATEHMAFVHTVGGVHYRDQAARTGLLGLSRAVRELGLVTTSDLEIDFAASSIGALNDKQLQDFHSAARGVDLVAQAREARSQAGAAFFKKKTKAQTSDSTTNIRDKIRIYFPTEETVRSSTAGAAGTICLQRTYFERPTFPRACFRDYKSRRAGLLSHNKILCARGPSVLKTKPNAESSSKENDGSTGDESQPKGQAWVYVGSSNMSQSAWGQLPAERTENKITCRNWECGVILPISQSSSNSDARKEAVKLRDSNGDSETESEDEEGSKPDQAALVSLEAFNNVLELPFRVPGDPYGDREPWYFTEQQ